MDVESIFEYAKILDERVEESFPFGETTLVFKIESKVFLLVSLDEIPVRINVKCDPEQAITLRENYTSIIPGYHMNKKHWNSIILDGSLSTALVKEQIKNSFELIISKLPKSKRMSKNR